MGVTFSAETYIKQVRAFGEKELERKDDEAIKMFLVQSCDFFNVFTTTTLEDYRQLKKLNPNNLIFLISQVSPTKSKLYRLPK